MSASQLRLASFILKEHFGEIVEEVGLYILRKGWTTLAGLKQETSLNIAKIKRALCVLIQHDVVKFKKTAKNQVSYTAQLPNILTILQYHKLTYCAKLLYGDACELIVEELLHHGSMSMTKIVQNVTHRLLDPALNQSDEFDQHYVANQFAELVEGHFIKRVSLNSCLSSSEEDAVYSVDSMGNSQYCLPAAYSYQGTGKRKITGSNSDEPTIKRRKDENEQALLINFEDEDILWQINFLQFSHHLANEMIINAVKNQADELAADIVKIMLDLTVQSRDGYAAQTNSVSVYDIADKSTKIDKSQITQYLSLLEDDQIGFVSKTAENCGGMYAVNIKKSMEAMCIQSIESVIRERCGSKSLRIFKLLLLKKHLEQKQVEELIMVPSKEAKELLYNLLSEKFVTLQEVPRTADYAPSRTFYLFSVKITQICRMLLDRSYKAQGNLISRRHHETEEHKRLVEKSEKIDATILALKNQGMEEQSPAVQELHEMMTDQEKQQLSKLKTVKSKLEQSELQVGETVLVFTQYLALNS